MNLHFHGIKEKEIKRQRCKIWKNQGNNNLSPEHEKTNNL